MSNLWFLWFLQECQRNCWELKLAIVHFRQPRLESLTEAVWTLIELCFCQSLLKPGASQLVYRAAAFTMEPSIARRIRVGAVEYRRRMPDAIAPSYSVCNFAASKDVDARCDDRSSDS
ncbi:hypothetical protein [Microcoleus sp. herbarium2]|uniref:hypothetical protein n=1 Tax=Microcoleus sp. herbarium2 TaxID=3055433 RepID=UPI002FD084F9